MRAKAGNENSVVPACSGQRHFTAAAKFLYGGLCFRCRLGLESLCTFCHRKIIYATRPECLPRSLCPPSDLLPANKT
jgi:hypothetical protein